jgi:DNA (cytosine-5)-methyltransferase 1
MELTHLSLFTGIGGLDLAAEWAGFETVGQCEWADYPTRILEKHWPDVPRWRDIRTLTKESFYERTGLRTVDIISGGFPCQPFSVAGNRKGEDDDRYLWPEMHRIISEIKPNWVIGENVAGIINMALDQVLSDLESIGYETQSFIIPACSVGALHKRNRVFILAHSDSNGLQGRSGEEIEERCHANQIDSVMSENSNVPYTTGQRLPGQRELVKPMYSKENTERKTSKSFDECLGNEWATEPELGRVANGIPNRVDRLKCLGNAVVPQQAYPIFRAIAEIERGIADA